MFFVDLRAPLTYGVVALAIVLVAMLASLLPARRASGVDPAEILRVEYGGLIAILITAVGLYGILVHAGDRRAA